MRRNKDVKKFCQVFAVVSLAIIALIYRNEIAEYLNIITDQKAVSAYLQSFGPLGPAILFVLMVAQVFIAVIPGHALILTAGYETGETILLLLENMRGWPNLFRKGGEVYLIYVHIENSRVNNKDLPALCIPVRCSPHQPQKPVL
jgi:hypothetical protein